MGKPDAGFRRQDAGEKLEVRCQWSEDKEKSKEEIGKRKEYIEKQAEEFLLNVASQPTLRI